MKKILIVEDEDIIRRGLVKTIEENIGGYSICGQASDGKEALNMLERVDPDIIITDIKMENISGLELIERVRLLNKSIPIIIITGYADFQYAKKAIDYDVAAYLLKPISRIELSQALEKVCPSQEEENTERDIVIVQKIKNIIKDNIDKELSLYDIANDVGLNHQYLSAMFKKRTGKNVKKYITEERMARAKHLLLTSNLRIYEIAELSGYNDVKYFIDVFRSMEGCTPSDFKNRRQ